MPVGDVVMKSFLSPLDLAGMERAVSEIAGLRWDVLDLPTGEYLRGLSNNGVKIRLLPGERWRLEVHFPVGPGWTRFTDGQKSDFVSWLLGALGKSAQASAERDEA